jgi:probable F420-dependent oxidoreductase
VDLEVVLPDESPDIPPGAFVELAQTAERLGYRTLYLPDHVLPPAPYGATYGGVYEPLVTLAHIAARTSTIRLGTSVLVLPLRSPFVVAKQVATLDRLSGGRAVLGVGVGWDRTEFAAVGADFATRGARTDEDIALLRHLFRDGGAFQGRFHHVEQGVFAPVPAQPVPIMVGGTSEAALRRAAALADEWQGVAVDADGFARCATRLRELSDRTPRLGTRLAWSGGSEDLKRTVEESHALAAAGADAVAVWFGAADGAAERMAEFAAAFRS